MSNMIVAIVVCGVLGTSSAWTAEKRLEPSKGMVTGALGNFHRDGHAVAYETPDGSVARTNLLERLKPFFQAVLEGELQVSEQSIRGYSDGKHCKFVKIMRAAEAGEETSGGILWALPLERQDNWGAVADFFLNIGRNRSYLKTVDYNTVPAGEPVVAVLLYAGNPGFKAYCDQVPSGSAPADVYLCPPQLMLTPSTMMLPGATEYDAVGAQAADEDVYGDDQEMIVDLRPKLGRSSSSVKVEDVFELSYVRFNPLQQREVLLFVDHLLNLVASGRVDKSSVKAATLDDTTPTVKAGTTLLFTFQTFTRIDIMRILTVVQPLFSDSVHPRNAGDVRKLLGLPGDGYNSFEAIAKAVRTKAGAVGLGSV